MTNVFQATAQGRAVAQDLLDFIHASPTPWHAVATCAARLSAVGYQALDERAGWNLSPGGKYFVKRDDGALIAFLVGDDIQAGGFRLIGAHTDSPGLRVKRLGAHEAGAYVRLATEIYGSPILATFADRDLLLAGRAVVRDVSAACGTRHALLRLDDCLVRLPNLAIHLNRNVNEEGLKLHKHSGLNLMLGQTDGTHSAEQHFLARLSDAIGLAPGDILAFDLCAVDAQPGAFFGEGDAFIASRQLDNLASCHAAVEALASIATAGAATAVIALLDHEEVGSESYSGAAGRFLEQVLMRIVASASPGADAFSRALAGSWHLSADMAHAFHPAHPDCHDGQHNLLLNSGVALKLNAGQRYASGAPGEAMLRRVAEAADVPVQTYVHRADLACGSTIGPICAARLGMRSVDIGMPMWAMHSCRESAGTEDPILYQRLMRQFLSA